MLMIESSPTAATLNVPMPPPRHTESWQSEDALIEGLLAHDEESYEVLVRQYGGSMLAVAQRFCRCSDEAQDVLQEALLSAFRGIRKFRRGSRLGTWLHRITVNAALMRLRRGASRPEVQIDELQPFFDSAGRHAGPVPSLHPTSERRLLEKETRRWVRACIDRLPQTLRTVLILRDIEELDTLQVAQLLDVTTNAVKIRLHRARLALAKIFSEEQQESSSVSARSRVA